MKYHEQFEKRFKDLHTEAVDQTLHFLKQRKGLSEKECDGLNFIDPDADMGDLLTSNYKVLAISSNGEITGEYYHGDSVCFDINSLKLEELIFLLDTLESLPITQV